jgi:hypothetical protein
MNKRIILIGIFSIIFLIGAADAVGATTITFTEVFSDPPPTQIFLAGDEWSAYGITTTNAYWYADIRDTVDNKGIAQTVNPGRIDFIIPTNAVTIDWFTALQSGDIHVEAYDSGNNLVDSFVYNASVTKNGTDTLTGVGISYILFYDGAGTVGISTLIFTPLPQVPAVTPIGLIALVSALSAIAAVTIVRKRR